tara:strand:- start:133 stop:336 length:204 start_codon:yes stop_codon:yes gene_type:complete
MLSGCQSEKRSKYFECIKSGTKDLYGNELAPEFCRCMADSLADGSAPFETGNKCAKPILKKMLLDKE